MEGELRLALGEGIELSVVTPSQLGRFEADLAQLERIVKELVADARHAMPDGGRLTIETADVEVDTAQAAQQSELELGRYVMLAVTDSREGLTPEVRSRIFEPFFTTKKLGHGSGLGLATVLGVVRQSRAHIVVDGGPGRGASFKIYFPRSDRPAMSPDLERPR
jgi:signal transduction histidine kinase